MQAVNAVGVGAFSIPIKVTTRALPPYPPTLEVVNVGSSSVKLKWGDGKNIDLLRYVLEMRRDDYGRYQSLRSADVTLNIVSTDAPARDWCPVQLTVHQCVIVCCAKDIDSDNTAIIDLSASHWWHADVFHETMVIWHQLAHVTTWIHVIVALQLLLMSLMVTTMQPNCVHFFIVLRPLPSTRQHSSSGNCLEGEKEYYQNCSVLNCVTQCSHLYEQFLQVQQIGFVTLGPLHRP